MIAKEIRQKIKQTTGLNASAGISVNKFIAKVASGINKPNGQKTVNPEEVEEYLEKLEIIKFHGIGKVTEEKMYQLGIFKGADLKLKSEVFLVEHFGKSGSYYYNVVRGIHLSEVKLSRIRIFNGVERTYDENIFSEIFMHERLKNIAPELENRAKKIQCLGKNCDFKDSKTATSAFKPGTRSFLILSPPKTLLWRQPGNYYIRRR